MSVCVSTVCESPYTSTVCVCVSALFLWAIHAFRAMRSKRLLSRYGVHTVQLDEVHTVQFLVSVCQIDDKTMYL